MIPRIINQIITMTISRFYTTQETARDGAVKLSDEIKDTVYVWKQQIDRNQYEYQLRTLDQLMNVNSEYVIHKEVYQKTRSQKAPVSLPRPGLIRTLKDSNEPQLIFKNTGPIEGKEHHYGNIYFEGVEVGSWNCSQNAGELTYHLDMNESETFIVYSKEQLKLRATDIWTFKML